VTNDLYHLPLLACTVRLLADSLPAWTARDHDVRWRSGQRRGAGLGETRTGAGRVAGQPV